MTNTTNILYPSFYELSDDEKFTHTLEAVESLKNQLEISFERLKALSDSSTSNMKVKTLQSFAEGELCDIHTSWYNNIKIGIKNDYPKSVDEDRVRYQ